jgi:HlyD family secretion protein
MRSCSRYAILYFVLVALMAIPVSADRPATARADEAAKKDDAKKDVPATQTIKKGLLKITVELDAVFEGAETREVMLRPEEWTALTVLRAVPHGTVVRKGDVLLELETDKLDRAITDARTDLTITNLALQQSEEQLKALEKTTPLDLESGERAAKVAEEDRKYYFDVERPFSIKSAEFTLKSTKEQLEYELEELRQLEKMYKADDITEETEAIVLKRGRDAVDRAKFGLEAAQVAYDSTMAFGLPRKDISVKESTARKLLEWEKSKVTLPMDLQRQRLELEKLRWQRSQAEERLNRLVSDRKKQMTAVAPIDGVVYYGKILRGRPGDSTGFADMLRPGGVIQQQNPIILTVVQPRPMFVRANVPETELHDMRPNVPGVATPTAYPDLKLPVTLDTTSDIPVSPGVFDARLTVDLKGKTKLLMPGMTCKVKLTPYLKQDAITVPPSAIVTDDLDEEKQTVQVLENDGTTKTRPVTVGRKTDKQVEILTGLSEGDKVVIEPSKTQK